VQIQGKDLAVTLRLLELQPWLFYPSCEFLFQVENVEGLTERDTAPTNLFSEIGVGAVSVLFMVGGAQLREITVVQREVEVLGTYKLVDKEDRLVFQRSK